MVGPLSVASSADETKQIGRASIDEAHHREDGKGKRSTSQRCHGVANTDRLTATAALHGRGGR